jgi:uncharacterized protein
MFGLHPSDLNEISKILSLHPEIISAKIFGSRALGTFKRGSDVDIALFSVKPSHFLVAKVHAQLEELSAMPYQFDIVLFSSLTNENLKNHILTHGIEFYRLND